METESAYTILSMELGTKNVTRYESTIENLQVLDKQMSADLLPVTIYVILLACFGTVGNCIVVYVYWFKWKQDETVKYFIGYLACLNLATSLLVMPIESAMLIHPIILDSSALCKFLRFSRAVTSLASGFMLVVIAVDRYRLICRHTKKQIDVRLAKKLCLATFLGSIFCSWPAILIFGKFDRGDYSLRETSCSTSDTLRETHYPILFYGLLFLLFFAITICLFVSYGFVGTKIYNVSKSAVKTTSRPTSLCNGPPSISSPSEGEVKQEVEKTLNVIDVNSLRHPEKSNVFRVPSLKRKGSLSHLTRHVATAVHVSLRRRDSRLIRKQKTTLTLFLITSLVFISFLPYISLTLCKSVISEFLGNLSKSQQVWYNIGILSDFLSSGLNPVVYGFCSKNFRKRFMAAR